MTDYAAHSAHGSDSVSRAYRIGSWLHVSTFEGGKYASTALTTDAARTFARGILTLADEIDGGEAEAAPSDTRPQVGEKHRVTEAGAWHSDVKRGDVVTVTQTCYDETDEDNVRATDPRGHAWWLPVSALTPVVDTPEPALADWERELLEGPARSPRAKYVEEAKELYADKHAGPDEILRMAYWLAAGDE